jgi:hypothetical protein
MKHLEIEMAEFKIGDKVRLVDYQNLSIFELLKSINLDKVYTISNIVGCAEDTYINLEEFSDDDYGWYFLEV